MYTYTNTFAYTYTYTHTHTFACTFACTYTYAFACTFACTYTFTHYIYICKYNYTYTYTFAYTFTCTYTYTYPNYILHIFHALHITYCILHITYYILHMHIHIHIAVFSCMDCCAANLDNVANIVINQFLEIIVVHYSQNGRIAMPVCNKKSQKQTQSVGRLGLTCWHQCPIIIITTIVMIITNIFLLIVIVIVIVTAVCGPSPKKNKFHPIDSKELVVIQIVILPNKL